MGQVESRAIITNGQGEFELQTVEVSEPGPGELRIRIHASGICHTDWDSLRWGDQMVVGHEGAGVVDLVGEHVEGFAPGDHVLLNWAIPCGECPQCAEGNHPICESEKAAHTRSTRLGGEPIGRSFNLGTMSDYTVVRKEAVTKISEDIPFPSAAIVGCGVMTGFGSVSNVAKVEAGASVVVIGCGGVGLNVIQGAKVAGANPIIAIDLLPYRLQMAEDFGATHKIQPDPEDRDFDQVLKEVQALTGGRAADYAFEATGVPALGFMPLKLVRNAGMAVQVSGIEEEITGDMTLFEWDKTYINPLYGKCNPDRDFPKIFGLYQSGELLLDELVSKQYHLGSLAEGFDDMLNGRISKGVIKLID